MNIKNLLLSLLSINIPLSYGMKEEIAPPIVPVIEEEIAPPIVPVIEEGIQSQLEQVKTIYYIIASQSNDNMNNMKVCSQLLSKSLLIIKKIIEEITTKSSQGHNKALDKAIFIFFKYYPDNELGIKKINFNKDIQDELLKVDILISEMIDIYLTHYDPDNNAKLEHLLPIYYWVRGKYHAPHLSEYKDKLFNTLNNLFKAFGMFKKYYSDEVVKIYNAVYNIIETAPCEELKKIQFTINTMLTGICTSTFVELEKTHFTEYVITTTHKESLIQNAEDLKQELLHKIHNKE